MLARGPMAKPASGARTQLVPDKMRSIAEALKPHHVQRNRQMRDSHPLEKDTVVRGAGKAIPAPFDDLFRCMCSFGSFVVVRGMPIDASFSAVRLKIPFEILKHDAECFLGSDLYFAACGALSRIRGAPSSLRSWRRPFPRRQRGLSAPAGAPPKAGSMHPVRHPCRARFALPVPGHLHPDHRGLRFAERSAPIARRVRPWLW